MFKSSYWAFICYVILANESNLLFLLTEMQSLCILSLGKLTQIIKMLLL